MVPGRLLPGRKSVDPRKNNLKEWEQRDAENVHILCVAAGRLFAIDLLLKPHEAALRPGPHIIAWDGTNDASEHMASGIYIYRLEGQSELFSFQQSQRMDLIK